MTTAALHWGDCFDILPCLKRGAFSLVLADPPYGTTACKWDSCFDFDRMWSELDGVVKERAALVFNASQPFTSKLVCSNLKHFKCEWVWVKNRGSNPGAVKFHPMKEHESVLVFTSRHKDSVRYYPIKQDRSPNGVSRVAYRFNSSGARDLEDQVFSDHRMSGKNQENYPTLRYPSSVQKFNTQVGYHPTQKPVALMEYFVRTYSQPGDLVLDFCMGSGSTGVACVNTGRNFVGIEIDRKYFEIARARIAEARRGQLQ